MMADGCLMVSLDGVYHKKHIFLLLWALTLSLKGAPPKVALIQQWSWAAAQGSAW